jgi:hypothetical protein
MAKPTWFFPLALASCVTTQAPTPPARDLSRLSGTARAVLKKRMARHAFEARDLMLAVVLLEYDDAARLASTIASESGLARPVSNDASELNTQFPEAFFGLQDELKRSCRHVATAAQQQNPDELGRAFADVSQTCVRCHRLYETPAQTVRGYSP